MAVEVQAGKPRIDLSRYELMVDGRRVKLEHQPMELLILLVGKKGQLVTREDIVARLWGKEIFVEVDQSINAAIRKIRQALKDDPAHPKYLETVVSKGYRFIGGIEVSGSAPVNVERPDAGAVTVAVPMVAPDRRWRPMIVSGFVVILAAAAAWSWFHWRRAPGSTDSPIRSIAVLPFENLSSDPAQEYLADGMTDQLITDLARIKVLHVISRTSTVHYKGTKKTLPEIARELRVDAIAEGSVMRSGNRVRVTAQLIQAADDKHLWAESYERDLSDIMTLQSELAGAIAQEIKVTLQPAERASLAAARPVNPLAYEAYLRGLFFWNKWTDEGARKSIEYFQQAIQADPNYASAYAGLANSYIQMGDFGVGLLPSREANTSAERAALQAISLDETLGEAHAALAMSRFRSGLDWRGVEKEFHRAIELNPGSATAHHWYSHYLLAADREEEAIAEGERAYHLNPIDPEMGVHMQFLYLFLHRYDDVIAEGHKNLQLDPNFSETYFMNAQALEQKRMYKEASRAFSQALNLSGRRSMILASFGHLLGVSGHAPNASRILSELDALSEKRYVPSFEKGLVHVGLGNKEAALADLQQAYQEGSSWMLNLQHDVRLDPLRSDPRFQDLVRKVGFPH